MQAGFTPGRGSGKVGGRGANHTRPVFRLPGHSVYYMKIDEPTEGNDIRAVALNTMDMSGIVGTFAGEQEAFIGPMGLPDEWLKPLGF